MSSRIRRLGGEKLTSEAQYSRMSERFTPNWDKEISGAQERAHVAPREEMGQKMTPRGRGTLIRS